MHRTIAVHVGAGEKAEVNRNERPETRTVLSYLLGENQAGYIAPTTSQLGGCDDSNECPGADAFGLAAREGTATVKACAAKSLPSEIRVRTQASC